MVDDNDLSDYEKFKVVRLVLNFFGVALLVCVCFCAFYVGCSLTAFYYDYMYGDFVFRILGLLVVMFVLFVFYLRLNERFVEKYGKYMEVS